MTLKLHPCSGRFSVWTKNPVYFIEVINKSNIKTGCWNVKSKGKFGYQVQTIISKFR